MNENKLIFGKTLNSMDGCLLGNDCYHYGSVSGCDEDCPVLLDGKCSVWEENIEYMDEDLIKIYKAKETK